MVRFCSQYGLWSYEGNIHTLMKKLSHKEWRDLVRVEFKGKGRNRHCSAICPICLISYDVDILSSDASAHKLAVEKVASHVNSAHADMLTDRN
jgi:hypothetical protein